MRKFLLAFCPIFLSVSCASLMQNHSYGSITQQIDHIGDNYCRVYVDYKSTEYLQGDLKQKAEIGIWDSARTRSEAESLPQGGYVIVKLFASSLESANQRNWEYVVQDASGKEIQRTPGISKIPDFDVSGGITTWNSIGIAEVSYPFDGPFKISILSTIFNQKYTFMIYPQQKGCCAGTN